MQFVIALCDYGCAMFFLLSHMFFVFVRKKLCGLVVVPGGRSTGLFRYRRCIALCMLSFAHNRQQRLFTGGQREYYRQDISVFPRLYCVFKH
jgi:hypothetical protein